MLEKFQSIIKLISKELVFVLIGIALGILFSSTLKMYIRNQCIRDTLKTISTLHDDKDINLLNTDEYIKKIDMICGKLK